MDQLRGCFPHVLFSKKSYMLFTLPPPLRFELLERKLLCYLNVKYVDTKIGFIPTIKYIFLK